MHSFNHRDLQLSRLRLVGICSYGSCTSLSSGDGVGVCVPALAGLPGAMLVAASPVGPVQRMLAVPPGRRDDGTAQQSQQFGDGDGDHRGGGAGGGVLGAFEGGGDGEEDIRCG